MTPASPAVIVSDADELADELAGVPVIVGTLAGPVVSVEKERVTAAVWLPLASTALTPKVCAPSARPV